MVAWIILLVVWIFLGTINLIDKDRKTQNEWRYEYGLCLIILILLIMRGGIIG